MQIHNTQATRNKGGYLNYLNSKPKEKFPVGKVGGVDSHTYKGSHVMHILVEKLTEGKDGQTLKSWVLKCAPTKPGAYSYMGFRPAVTCVRCKTRGGIKDETD